MHDHILRSDSYFVYNDIANELEIDSWKPFAKLNGIKSCIILPIKKEGQIIGSFNMYSSEINFFDEEEIALLVEATSDISYALDIFEKEVRHKQAEEIIIKNENRFRSLIEKSTGVKMLSNVNGEFIYGSPSVTKVFDYSVEEFLHKSAFTFFHPDDLPDLMKNRAIILGIPGGSFSFQYRLLHKNGSWIWCEGTLTNMLHEPGINAFVSNFNDISERKQAELKAKKLSDRLNLATTSAGIGIWDWDIVNDLYHWDGRMYSIYDIAEKEFSSLSEGWTSRVHHEDRARVEEEMQNAVAKKNGYESDFSME
jgi:PAS domain S-box-containing protein